MKRIFYLIPLLAFFVIGCRKSKIEKNLNDTWAMTEIIVGTDNLVSSGTSVKMEFSTIKKGEGGVTFTVTDSQGTYYSTGSLQLDKKYEQMTVTIVSNGVTTIFDGEFTVDESKFELTGTYSDSYGDNLPLKMKGYKS